MLQLKKRLKLAQRELGKSVVSINPNIFEDIKNKINNPLYFGIKDTKQIPQTMINELIRHQKFLWTTVDKTANRGRAIDTDLINPLTYRVMTGSTSGGPINILKGINDFAIGTDGGGSVLAPAMSCQLPAMIGAGLNLFVSNKKVSTDGIEFTASIGVIGKNFTIVKKVIEEIIGQEFPDGVNQRKLKIIIPKKGSIGCSDQEDMHKKVMYYFSKLDLQNYILEEMDMTGIEYRKVAIQMIQESFHSNGANLIVTCEGPIDIFGYGETLPMNFGKVGKEISQNHGKYLLRAANMCKTTAITIPTENLATGLLIIGKSGIEHATYAVRLASQFERVIELPEIWKRYYLGEQETLGLDFFEPTN